MIIPLQQIKGSSPPQFRGPIREKKRQLLLPPITPKTSSNRLGSRPMTPSGNSKRKEMTPIEDQMPSAPKLTSLASSRKSRVSASTTSQSNYLRRSPRNWPVKEGIPTSATWVKNLIIFSKKKRKGGGHIIKIFRRKMRKFRVNLSLKGSRR